MSVRSIFGVSVAIFLVFCSCVGGGSGNGKLVVEVSPKDGGSVTRDIEENVYPAGTDVKLTARSAAGYRFKEWSGAAYGNSRTVRVTITGNMKVTAVFEKVDDLAEAVEEVDSSAAFERSDDLAMVFVKGGTFTMGCTPEQGGDCDIDEGPSHSVTVDDFSIMKYEVTQKQWTQVMGSNPSNFRGDDLAYAEINKLPVEGVSWNDVQEFIQKLNEKTGKKYRLPTEAEWEYAARGGNQSKGFKYAGSNNIDDVAWYDGNSGDKTNIVGTKAPNELGIYDMSGNVWELVSDWYGPYSNSAKTNPAGSSSGSYRVRRGGSWDYDAGYCRVSIRYIVTPDYRSGSLGFRLVLSP